MRNKIVWIILIVFGWLEAATLQSYIVIASERSDADLGALERRLSTWIDGHDALRRTVSEAGASLSRLETGVVPAVEIGPFDPDRKFAQVYLGIRDAFPGAVVVERAVSAPSAGASSSRRHPASVPTVTPVSVSDDTDEHTIWIALFGLAIIGVLYMFLSSDQLRRIKEEHAHIEERQRRLEVKQHTLLARMGEEIHTLAEETASHARTLVQREHNLALREDAQKVLEGESELLGITSNLIQFLQIKSEKVTITMAPFDLNNVLHEVAGALQGKCRASDKELIFDIDRRVPKVLLADSEHLTQVLVNLLEHFMCRTEARSVRLQAVARTRSDHTHTLQMTISADTPPVDEETLFDAYYDEQTHEYVGLGLFVARELVRLMGGQLQLGDRRDLRAKLALIFPVGKHDGERRQYRLPSHQFVDRHALVVDRNPDVLLATEHVLSYFRLHVTGMEPEQFASRRPELSSYALVLIETELLDADTVAYLEEQRRKYDIKILGVENLYASRTHTVEGIVDGVINKPLTQQHACDALERLDAAYRPPLEEGATDAAEPASDRSSSLPEVYRGDFEDRPSTRLEDFARFKGARLMVVEDNPVNQKVLKGMLAKAGVEITIANNGQEALDLLEEKGDAIEMILMDISMPVMDGFTATRRIHEDARFRHIPIVTLTALVSQHEVDKMFDAGANGYLSKPLKIGRLYRAMERFLPVKTEGESVPHTPTDTAVSEADVSPGIDVNEAIESMRRNRLVYREVLKEFRELYGRSDAVFEKLIRDTRYEQLKTLCVDLRGLSGSIGAKGLFAIVTEAQTLLLYRKYDLLERLIDPYRQELARVNAAIERYIR
jgi:CheY-like chemotaxis protein/signal transduction histidine kinase